MPALFETEPKMSVTALAPWKGSNRMLASHVGKALAGCEWVGIVFAGGMSEVPHIEARTLLVNDIHRHVMNLACVVAADAEKLSKHLSDLPFHPDVLAFAQCHCLEMERGGWDFSKANAELSERWALNYFISCWMARSGKAGTKDEFKGNIPIRWEAGGGDSNTRYRSAVDSIAAWSETMKRCNFTTLDFREFIGNCKDEPRHGIYSDSPFPDAGDDYKHPFTDRDHSDLARLLAGFKKARVVARFYDHPKIRELYPESKWKWNHLAGRDQKNAKKPEVLLTNGH